MFGEYFLEGFPLLRKGQRGIGEMKNVQLLRSYKRIYRTSLVAQMVECMPTMWETWVRSLGREDPLEKEMATYPSILAWKIPWTEEPGGPQSMG